MRSLPEFLCNFHWVADGEAARSAQLYAGLLGPFLRRRNIRGVINLRGHHPEFGWWRDQTRACARFGIRHHDAMLDSRMLPTRGMLVALLRAFEEAPRPFLIKCSGGQDRTSLAAALYLLWKDGTAAIDRAEAQFAAWPYLHFPKPQQRWLRLFPRYALAQAEGGDLSSWLRERYAPEDFARWLRDAGKGDTFSSIFPAALSPE